MDNFLDKTYKKSVSDKIRRYNKKKKIQYEANTRNVTLNPAYTIDIVAIVNNLDESKRIPSGLNQNIDKINSCTSSESSHKIKVNANISQYHIQKCIGNFIVDLKVPHDIKTVNN